MFSSFVSPPALIYITFPETVQVDTERQNRSSVKISLQKKLHKLLMQLNIESKK